HEVQEVRPRVVDDAPAVAARSGQARREGETACARAAAAAGDGGGRRASHDGGRRGAPGNRRRGRGARDGGRRRAAATGGGRRPADDGGGGRADDRARRHGGRTRAVVLALPVDVARTTGRARAAPGRIAVLSRIEHAVAAERGDRSGRRRP